MDTLGRRRTGGLALALGGLLGLAFALILYVFTHGSTQYASHDTLWSWDGATWCRLQVIQPGLLLAGMVLAFGPSSGELGRRGRIGLITAITALAAQVLALVLRCWLVHPDEDFGSLPVILGFMLGVVAYVPLAAGLVMLGLDGRLSRARRLVLLLGILVVPTIVLAFALQDLVSTGGWAWELGLTAVHLPLAVAWMLRGWAVWLEANRAAAGAQMPTISIR